MPIRHEPAICLRHFDYSETSQVVHLFTEQNGVVHLLAKGSKRLKSAFDGGLDLLDAGVASFTLGREAVSTGMGKSLSADAGPPMGLLTAWYQTDAHRGLHRSLLAQAVGVYAGELATGLVTEMQAEPHVFAALQKLLAALDAIGQETTEKYPGAHQDSAVAELLAFQVRLLQETGYSPLVERCVGTQWPIAEGETAWFSPSAGGVLNRDAEAAYADRMRITPQERAAMAGKPAPPPAQRTAVQLLAEHLEYVAERRFKTFAHLRAHLDW